MARRSLLSTAARERLFGIPVDRDELARRYTFDRQDLALIATRRGDANRLGFAVQLALLHHPGFGLSPAAAAESALVAHIAEQLAIDPAAFAAYAGRSPTISDHARTLEQALGLRPCARIDLPLMITAAAQAAWPTDQGEPIAVAVMTALRDGGLVLPAPDTIERAGLAGRARARKQVAATLLAGMTDALAARLDALLTIDPKMGRPPLSWMKDLPRAPKPSHIRELLDKLAAVRDLGLDPRAARAHPPRPARALDARRSDHASLYPRALCPVAAACHRGRCVFRRSRPGFPI